MLRGLVIYLHGAAVNVLRHGHQPHQRISKMKLLSNLSRQTECETHEWVSTVNSGLRRDVCMVCGSITMHAEDFVVSISQSLQSATQG